MESVRMILEDVGLESYADIFETEGYTSLDKFLHIDHEEMEELSDRTGLFGQDFRVFVRKVRELEKAYVNQQHRHQRLHQHQFQ